MVCGRILRQRSKRKASGGAKGSLMKRGWKGRVISERLGFGAGWLVLCFLFGVRTRWTRTVNGTAC